MESASYFYELCVSTLESCSSEETSGGGLSEDERTLLEEMMSVWKLLMELEVAASDALLGAGQESLTAESRMIRQLDAALRWLQWRTETLETDSRQGRATLSYGSGGLLEELRRGRLETAKLKLPSDTAETDAKILEAVVVRDEVEVVRVARRAVENGARGELVAFCAGLGMEEFIDPSNAFEVLWAEIWSLRQCLRAGETGHSLPSLCLQSHRDFVERLCRIYARKSRSGGFFLSTESPLRTSASAGAAGARVVARRLVELGSALVFDLGVEEVFESCLMRISDELDVASNVHGFLGYLGVYLQSQQPVFDPEISEKTDLLVERQIMSFFAAKGPAIALGRAAAFLAEHVARISQPELRTKVWAGCFLELANLPADFLPSVSASTSDLARVGEGGGGGGGGGVTERLVGELVGREGEFKRVAEVVRHLGQEAVELGRANPRCVGVAMEVLASAMLQSARKSGNGQSVYGVFAERTDRMIVDLMHMHQWSSLAALVDSIYSLDAQVLLAVSGTSEFLQLAVLCVQVDRLQAPASPAQATALAPATAEAVRRLALGSAEPCVHCHSQEEKTALRHAVFFVLSRLIETLSAGSKGMCKALLEESVVRACEESEWLFACLGETLWARLGELADRALM